jgi:hypothetical protein
MPPDWLVLEPQLGSVDELSALAQDITASGGNLSLYYEPQTALWGESGYSARSDLALAITNIALEGYTRHYNHYFTLQAIRHRFTNLSADLANQQIPIGLALDTIGSLAYSDFRDDNPASRSATIAAYQSLLSQSSVRLTLYRPNDYLLNVTEAYYDMPLTDNGYIYTSQTVPFLPIVLAGVLPSYGGALNFSSNMRDDLLRHIEYGIYPSYFLTQRPTADLINTPSGWIYTSSIDQWGQEIERTYQWLNSLLAPVKGQGIIAHQQIAAGVSLTTYASGQQIIVNYNDDPYLYHDITIQAKDAMLLENGL